MTLLIAALIDLSIILAVALAALLLMRGRSAALRHWILAGAIIAGAAAPALELLLPQWPVPLAFGERPAEFASTLRFTSAPLPAAAVSDAVDHTGHRSTPLQLPWAAMLVLGWMAGALVGLAGLLTGLVRLARYSSRCTPIQSGPWREMADRVSAASRLPRVEILQSSDPALLVTWGLVQPRIILPAGAADWTDSRRRVVLAHEMAHIRRRDWLLHIGAEALRAFYWVNPLAWVACRRLRQESEYACDDAVLSGGIDPAEYATHLLDVARQAIGHRRAWTSAPAIAHPSTLERRVSAMLSHSRNREPLTARACALAVLAVIAVAIPTTAIGLASAPEAPVVRAGDVALRSMDAPPAPAVAATVAAARAPLSAPAPPAQQTPAAVSGTVHDPSGAVLPGVEVTLTDTQFGVKFTAATDGSGAFAFPDLQPGRYELVTTLPGFASVSNVLTLAAGARVNRRITLPLGSLQETITVGCSTQRASASSVLQYVRTAPDAGDAPLLRQQWTRVTPQLTAPPEIQEAARKAVLEARRLSRTPWAQSDTPVRVGGQIDVPRQTSHVNPLCPAALVPSADTVVTLVGRIGIDGYMNEVRQIEPKAGETAPQPELVSSAIEAVRQWTYTPTLLNGRPVEVNITFTVLYRRM